MTDFDPNATPESNVFSEVVQGDAWLCLTAQEKAKRRAQLELENRMAEIVAVRKCWHQAELEREKLKEQLIIAKHNLLAISQLGTKLDTHVQFSKYALERMEKVEK